MADFQNLINEVDRRIRGLESELHEVARRQESLARAASGTPEEGHVVRKGETLSQIASQYGVTVEAIISLNNLADANMIREGQTLAIPALP
jgi:LysM repeat protein